MGSSATTDSLFIGLRSVTTRVFGLPPAAALRPWPRNLLHACGNAMQSDWLIAILVIGVVVTIAEPWNGRATGWTPSGAGADGIGWTRAIAGLVLTVATALSAGLMLLQRRALLADRQFLASRSDTAPGAGSDHPCLAAASHPGHAPPPPESAPDDARHTVYCDATIGDPAPEAWQPGGAELACLAERQPESAPNRDEAGAAAMQHAERIRALGQLAAGIAHDFNNLLTAVHGSASLMAHQADDPEATRRHAGMILDAAVRGQSITRRLVSFVRREESRPEPVDPRSVLHAMHQIAVHTLGPGISVQVDSGCPLPRVVADRGQLETVLVNLAVNARDAMPEGGTLSFAAALEVVAEGTIHPAVGIAGTYIRISVTDTGAGIDGLLLERVLEPFFTTKPPGHGTGLGLPMAKAFAEQCGGALALDSSPGRGTTVSLWLPVAEGDCVSATGAPKRVLLAEDDPMVSETLAAVLEDAGYDVALARTGAEALEIMRSQVSVDALVTDLSIRELGGLALIETAHRCRPGLPAILLTACPDLDAALAMKGALTGAFSLLRKPVSAVYLVARIEALIAAAAN